MNEAETRAELIDPKLAVEAGAKLKKWLVPFWNIPVSMEQQKAKHKKKNKIL